MSKSFSRKTTKKTTNKRVVDKFKSRYGDRAWPLKEGEPTYNDKPPKKRRPRFD